jgi:hypothetical protein
MKHDFAEQPDGEAADRFRAWLQSETIDSLQRTFGDAEGTKSAVFLFVNRAYESHMPEDQIGRIFGRCIVRAGFRKEDEPVLFDWLEFFAGIAVQVHRPK